MELSYYSMIHSSNLNFPIWLAFDVVIEIDTCGLINMTNSSVGNDMEFSKNGMNYIEPTNTVTYLFVYDLTAVN
jgi:hypothetical protein